DDKLMGYIARKQTHLHKVAMVLSASYKDERKVTIEDLQVADQMLTSVEGCLDKVFAQIGRTEQSVNAEKFVNLIRKKGKVVYEEAYRLVHVHFPDMRDFEGICAGAIRSGQIVPWQDPQTGRMYLTACEETVADIRPLSNHNTRTAEVIDFPGVDTEV